MNQNTSIPPRISLLTDFGSLDTYIGVMKGVIATICPQAIVQDLSHGVEAQQVAEGAFLLASSYRYFPQGTIHLAVVDPGVGTERELIAAKHEGFYFVAPDNGLLGGVFCGKQPQQAVYIREKRFFLEQVSGTFHGRDILAPAAAHLANGLKLEDLGPPYQGEVKAPWPASSEVDGKECGEIIHVDHFGNCITNIFLPRDYDSQCQVAVEGMDQALPLLQHYGQVTNGSPLALRSSAGYLEIALSNGNAKEMFQLSRGTKVSLCSTKIVS